MTEPRNKIAIDWSKRQVMAILNATPDSFYSESRRANETQMQDFVRKAIDAGATIIDIGGYSSRPNAEEVSEEEEWQRVRSAILATREVAPTVAISIDTFRSSVARQAIEQFGELGELIINDITAGEADDEIIDVAAKYKVPYIAMHMKGTPQTMQQMTDYKDITEDVVNYFRHRIALLEKRGVQNVIIDPGFGFAKTLEQNYELLRGLNRLRALQRPVLAGISRKSMIYKTLNKEPKDALAGTIALNWEALRQGATILRVHDTAEAADTIKIFEKYL